ncbi:MAG: hypothetical protein AB1641_30505 [Thermodesulfobacteriota bacterium]
MFTCERCGHQHQGLVCGDCRGLNPPEALFCCHCGRKIKRESAGEAGGDKNPYDLENRVLCRDESCIGIINEAGVCTECGRRPEEIG